MSGRDDAPANLDGTGAVIFQTRNGLDPRTWGKHC